MKNRILSILLIIACTASTMTGCALLEKEKKPDANGVLTLKIAHDSAETVPVAIGLAKFEELVEEKTDGKIQVEVYNNGQLGSTSDYVVNTQLGTLDMAVVNQSVMSSYVDDVAAVDIPYLIENYDHADRVFEGETGDYYAKEIQDLMGTHVLDIWEVGFRELTNSDHPVNSIEDVKGLKIRTMDNKIHQAFWKSLGADPVPMSWNEAYTAMQQKAIDGQENPLSIILGNNVAEVNKELALTDHVYSSIFFLISDNAWNALTDEQRQIFSECAKEAGVCEREEQRNQEKDALDKLEALGMKVTEPDKTAFIEASKKFQDQYKEKYKTVIDMVNAAK